MSTILVLCLLVTVVWLLVGLRRGGGPRDATGQHSRALAALSTPARPRRSSRRRRGGRRRRP